MVSARSRAVYNRARREAIHYPQGGAMSRENWCSLRRPASRRAMRGSENRSTCRYLRRTLEALLSLASAARPPP